MVNFLVLISFKKWFLSVDKEMIYQIIFYFLKLKKWFISGEPKIYNLIN